MKTVYLPSGPQGAGKSTLCNAVVKKYPHIHLLSRDAIAGELIKKNGPASALDRSIYLEADKELLKRLADLLQQSSEITIILDWFIGMSKKRSGLVHVLRNSGVNQIICWNITTPREVSMEWFLARQNVSGVIFTEAAYTEWYENFRIQSLMLPEEGFDIVHNIDMSSEVSFSEIM